LIMAKDIVWGTSFKNALDLAKKTNKLVLAVFFDPCCESCNRMTSSTLISECVQDYVNKYFIPLKYESGADSDQFMRFGVAARPAILVFDAEGTEIFRKIGYFEPEVLIKKLEMAIKKGLHRAASCHGGTLGSGLAA
jgi:thioredoxin-related protein